MITKKSGFTFIEIMVVTAILGFLIAIAVPNYIRAREKAAETVCVGNQKTIYTAVTMYILKETDSIESMSDAERLEALTDAGYLRGNKWAECPSSSNDGDYDDYIITFENGFVSNVDCDEKGALHNWE
ncbi:MAG: prepilin-type N-terminal cleavage/methylation domain-containing protein [Candidatus Omnitrophica bacterium]|nr:prepilin-type N-terminal cleavage/methylation domain-containing protein [Candidatus Omnitrophota bacterium]